MTALLEPDRDQIEVFVQTLFRYAGTDGYVAVRSFFEDADKPLRISSAALSGGLRFLIDVAEDDARRAAQHPKPAVFCPPLAIFNSKDRAREQDIAAGLALSVECDEHPQEARATLEQLLGPATVVVKSGGVWRNSGEAADKLHLHWRLVCPARGDDLPRLKQARDLAARIVGGDLSNKPVSHPIRWPGSWHRKAEPRLCQIETLDADREIDLDTALAALTAAAPVKAATASDDAGLSADLPKLVGDIFSGRSFHAPLVSLAARCIGSRMHDGTTVNLLRALMLTSTALHDEQRWQSRFDSIPRIVASAREKYATANDDRAPLQFESEPADLWGNFEPPTLPRGLLPELIENYTRVQAETMGVDPGGIAMAALAVCAAAIPDRIQLVMKQHTQDWTESARLWVALVGMPSTKKSPIITTTIKPLATLDFELLRKFRVELRIYEEMEKDERKKASKPVQKRLRLEDTTIEGAQEVLAGSPDGVLLVQDELSGFFGSMDKYSGHRGAAKDRGFWLQSWNGGQYALNRINRGARIIPNLSVSLLGGIQPELIRRLSAESYDDGFLQRMLLVVMRPAEAGRDVPTPEVSKDYARLVEQLTRLKLPVSSRDDDGVLRFDSNAQDLRGKLEIKHLVIQSGVEAINRKLAAHIGKYDGYFGRLCVVWQCIEHAFGSYDRENDTFSSYLPATVTLDTATRVAEFMRRFLLPHAYAFYGGILGLADDHDRLAAVAGYILAHEKQRLTNRDVQRGCRSMRKLERRDTEAVFEQLEALGWVTRTAGPRLTDPAHWIVNPAVHRKFAERAKTEAERRQRERAIIIGMIQGRE